jgi:hypothetical protein
MKNVKLNNVCIHEILRVIQMASAFNDINTSISKVLTFPKNDHDIYLRKKDKLIIEKVDHAVDSELFKYKYYDPSECGCFVTPLKEENEKARDDFERYRYKIEAENSRHWKSE